VQTLIRMESKVSSPGIKVNLLSKIAATEDPERQAAFLHNGEWPSAK
jgi:hypothetical protein